MNTGYRRQQAQGNNEPGWLLFCGIVALALALAALPWAVVGFVAQRYTQRYLHWRLSFLLWTILLFVGAYALNNNYHHGLDMLYQRETTDYILAAQHYQYDLASYPLRQLWADTWPVWLHTWQGIGIAGFVAELYANRNDTARTLRQNEQRRIGRGLRLQRRAKKRTSRPAFLPDEVGGHMVMGVPIEDDNEE